jgi:hypothetical protein
MVTLSTSSQAQSHPVERSQRTRSRQDISRHNVREVTGRANSCAAARSARKASSSAISRSWAVTSRSARSLSLSFVVRPVTSRAMAFCSERGALNFEIGFQGGSWRGSSTSRSVTAWSPRGDLAGRGLCS